MFSALILLILSCFTIGIMIKLFKVKEKQRELAENSNGTPPVKKQSASDLHLHMFDLDLCLFWDLYDVYIFFG